MKRLLHGALAALVFATPASAVNNYRPTDSSGMVSPEPRDYSAGLGSEDSPDLAGAMPGRRPAPFFSGPGWQKDCRGQFSVPNFVLQATTMTSPWAGSSSTSPAIAVPTLTSENAAAPDGTTTASTLVVPTVSGTNAFSVWVQSFTAVSQPLTASMWVLNPVGGSTVWVQADLFYSSLTHYFTKPVPSDGAWHKVVIQLPFPGIAYQLFFSAGIDLRDGTESASSAPVTLRLWHPQLTAGLHGEVFNFVPTTTAAATATQTIPCPTDSQGRNLIAFRNYSRLTPWAVPPVQANGLFPPTSAFLTWNASNAWEAGGTSNPLAGAGITVNGVRYAWAASTTSGNLLYQNLSLYQSTSPGNWSEVPGVNPVFAPNGGTMQTTLLHGQFAKCSSAPFCVYFSAAPSSNAAQSAIFLSTASVVTGPYSTPTIVVPNTVLDATNTASNPSLPGIIDVDGVQYMYVARATNGISQSHTNYLTSSDTDGLTWIPQSTALPAAVSGDWDFPRSSGVEDNDVIQNACGPGGRGFFEYYDTANSTTGSFHQQIGVYISPWPTGPWWKMNGPIVPINSPLTLPVFYAGRSQPTPYFLGTSDVSFSNGTFYYSATASGGGSTGPSGIGVQATMPDACANYRAN